MVSTAEQPASAARTTTIVVWLASPAAKCEREEIQFSVVELLISLDALGECTACKASVVPIVNGVTWHRDTIGSSAWIQGEGKVGSKVSAPYSHCSGVGHAGHLWIREYSPVATYNGVFPTAKVAAGGHLKTARGLHSCIASR